MATEARNIKIYDGSCKISSNRVKGGIEPNRAHKEISFLNRLLANDARRIEHNNNSR